MMSLLLKKITKSNDRTKQPSTGEKLKSNQPSSYLRRQSITMFRKRVRFSSDGEEQEHKMSDVGRVLTEKVHQGNCQFQKKMTLADLKQKNPPGFKKFQETVDSQMLNEEVALKLWEDIFKPLYTFDLLQTDPKFLEM